MFSWQLFSIQPRDNKLAANELNPHHSEDPLSLPLLLTRAHMDVQITRFWSILSTDTVSYSNYMKKEPQIFRLAALITNHTYCSCVPLGTDECYYNKMLCVLSAFCNHHTPMKWQTLTENKYRLCFMLFRKGLLDLWEVKEDFYDNAKSLTQMSEWYSHLIV
jgi:hypothetical protein